MRGPTGINGELYFQKHDEKLSIPHVRNLNERLGPAHVELLEVPNAQARVACAQMNVVQFHTWNSLAKKIDGPDRMIFHLGPVKSMSWQHVQEAATLVRALLDQLGLESWLKTYGGKSLHVVVPLSPRLDYDTVRGFSQPIAQHLARSIPPRFVGISGSKNRIGKLFVDYGIFTQWARCDHGRRILRMSTPWAWCLDASAPGATGRVEERRAMVRRDGAPIRWNPRPGCASQSQPHALSVCEPNGNEDVW